MGQYQVTVINNERIKYYLLPSINTNARFLCDTVSQRRADSTCIGIDSVWCERREILRISKPYAKFYVLVATCVFEVFPYWADDIDSIYKNKSGRQLISWTNYVYSDCDPERIGDVDYTDQYIEIGKVKFKGGQLAYFANDSIIYFADRTNTKPIWHTITFNQLLDSAIAVRDSAEKLWDKEWIEEWKYYPYVNEWYKTNE